jgi:chemotaxis protein CheD
VPTVKTYQRIPDEPDHERLFVDVSEYEVVDDGTTLVAYGLGACVGLAIYDPENDVGGLARAMLPRQSDGAGTSDAKYADTAVETMVRDAISAGAGYGTLEGYVVGGSDLLDLKQLPREVSENNVAAAREEFGNLDIPVEGTSVGGSRGRTVEFDTESGEIRVITAHASEPTLLRTGENRES